VSVSSSSSPPRIIPSRRRIHHAVADPRELADEIVEVAVGRVGRDELKPSCSDIRANSHLKLSYQCLHLCSTSLNIHLMTTLDAKRHLR